MLREINGIKIPYKSFITLKCITRKGVPHEGIRAVAGSLFGTGISKADAKLDFIDLIDELDNPNITNPILYSFIKVE